MAIVSALAGGTLLMSGGSSNGDGSNHAGMPAQDATIIALDAACPSPLPPLSLTLLPAQADDQLQAADIAATQWSSGLDDGGGGGSSGTPASSAGTASSMVTPIRASVKGYTLQQTIGYGSFGKVKVARRKQSTAENNTWPATIAVKIVIKHAPVTTTSGSPYVLASTQTIPTLSQVENELSSQPLSPHQHHTTMLMKELRIHSALHHPGIIRLFAVIEDGKDDAEDAPMPSAPNSGGFVYMLMEYASGGELFDKIGNLKITDFGFATVFAARSSKRSRFSAEAGHASPSRQKRLVSQACGSPPYIAPEVVLGPYDGESSDIWSCGIILLVLLLGVTLWDFPSTQSSEYQQYLLSRRQVEQALQDGGDIDAALIKRCFSYHPWYRVPTPVFDLVLSMLDPDPARRATMSSIYKHAWVARYQQAPDTDDIVARENDLLDRDLLCSNSERLASLIMNNSSASTQESTPSSPPDVFAQSGSQDFVVYSQPDFVRPPNTQHAADPTFVSFSQPTARPTMVANDQQENYDTFTQQPLDDQTTMSTTQKQKLFTGLLPSLRLTRFFTQLPPSQMQQALCCVFDHCCVNYTAPPVTFNPASPTSGQPASYYMAHFSTVDRRKCPLRGDVIATHAGTAPAAQGDTEELPLWVVVFHRRKGDPLEFKRLYQAVVENMSQAVYIRAE
ncbi:Chk1 protein kinase [Sorochytrium milnesiophthora]